MAGLPLTPARLERLKTAVAEATMNGSTPMSIMRLIVLAASFVCSVLSTK